MGPVAVLANVDAAQPSSHEHVRECPLQLLPALDWRRQNPAAFDLVLSRQYMHFTSPNGSVEAETKNLLKRWEEYHE